MKSTIRDIFNVTKRNLIRLRRTPQLLVFSSIQPVMFLLLFNYVFGGAVSKAGTGTASYISFLLPGILAQTSVFGSMQTGIGMADDLSKGVIDRFRSLPMSRAAIVAGRTLADAMRNLLVICIMLGVGTLIGFRFQNGWMGLLSIPIVLLFGYAFSWISLTIGLLVKDPETAQTTGFIWVFPLVFASSVFVPTASMPTWLRVFAENQPVTQTVNAVRYLTEGVGSSNAIWYSMLWAAGILMVFIPVAIWQYRKTV